MKVNLITGLDGAGKSTILRALHEKKTDLKCEVIFLPHADGEKYKENRPLYKAISFINALSKMADQQNLPVFKAVSVFSAMVLYADLLNFNVQLKPDMIFAERHPMIDTLAYAGFYLTRLGHDDKKPGRFDEIDTRFEAELLYIIDRLPGTNDVSGGSKTKYILDFIASWFIKEKRTKFTDLSELFRVSAPYRVYFLKVPPEILFGRVKNRGVKEPHEDIDALQKMDAIYQQVFNDFETHYPNRLHMVDAAHFSSLDAFKKQIISTFIT